MPCWRSWRDMTPVYMVTSLTATAQYSRQYSRSEVLAVSHFSGNI